MNKKATNSLAQRTFRKFLKNRLAVLGTLLFIIIIVASFAAPLLTELDPNKINFAKISKAPDADSLFGTDSLGRDVFARVLYGGQVSISIGIISSLASTLIGVILGGMAGYFGGKLDKSLVSISDIFLTLPQIILILIIMTFLGAGISNLIIIFSVTGWMTTFRMVRNEFLSLREETYVEVARAFGISDFAIIFKHILPNTLSPIMVATTLNIANFILQEAGLSFIGLGVPNQVATWGNIINAARSVEVIRNFWWVWLIPGLVISIFVLSVNFLGDGLRDVLDPKQ
jgi:peptide/nickel transport system permease protein